MDLLPVVEKSALGLLPLLILAAIGALWIRALASKAWWPVVFMSIGSLVLGVLLFWPAKGLVTLFLRTLWDLPVFLKWWCLFLASSLYGFLCGTSVFGKRRVASFLTWMPFLLAIALIVLSMNLGLAVAGMAWVCWVATTLGKRLLAQQKVVSLLPLGFAVGLGSLLLLAWVLGTLGWLVTPSVTLFLTVFSVVFWRDAAFTLQKLWRWFRRPLPYQGTVRAFQGLVWGLAMVAATTAVTPEAGSDALGGRVAMTARFLTQGSLHPFVDILWSFGTVGGEALQVWFYPFTGPRAARFLAASIVLILAFSRLFYWSKAGAILAPFMVSSLLLVHFVLGGIDTFQSFFWLASAWALFRAKQSKSLVFYAGFLASCAAAVKLNGLGAALAAALMLLFLYKRIGDIIRFGLWFSLGFTLGLAPWLGRSFFLTGNPLFPFFPAWFPNSIQNPPPIYRFGVGLDWPNVLTVPWLIFAKPEKFVEVGGLNPAMVFILFLVLISLAWTRARALSAAALGTWLFWLLTEQNLRYSLPANFVTVGAASLCLVPPTLHLRKATIAAATLLGTLLAFPADYARPIGWIFRGAGGLPFPQELLAKNLTEPEYSAVNIPTYAPGQLVKASRHPWPQVCETGLRDHLYVPGTQPTNWHSLQPLSQWIAELHFAATVDAAARAARKLNCDFIMLHAGQFAALPSHRRPPVFSEAFWQRFGEVMGAVRQTVLLRRKGVPTHAFEGGEVQSFQVTFFSDHPLPPPGAAGTPLTKEGRLWSQPIPLKKAGLLRCQWIAGEASSGFLDVAARSAENRLLLFYRQDFSLEQNEIFVFYQTMPEQTATISISINGTFSLPELQCTVR